MDLRSECLKETRDVHNLHGMATALGVPGVTHMTTTYDTLRVHHISSTTHNTSDTRARQTPRVRLQHNNGRASYLLDTFWGED